MSKPSITKDNNGNVVLSFTSSPSTSYKETKSQDTSNLRAEIKNVPMAEHLYEMWAETGSTDMSDGLKETFKKITTPGISKTEQAVLFRQCATLIAKIAADKKAFFAAVYENLGLTPRK